MPIVGCIAQVFTTRPAFRKNGRGMAPLGASPVTEKVNAWHVQENARGSQGLAHGLHGKVLR